MNSTHLTRFGLIAASVFIGSAILILGTVSKGQSSSKFNRSGNILIADQFNNRVIEIDPTGNIVWQFGSGPGNITPSAITGSNDAERVNDLTLMSGTGIPAGPISTTHCKKGCADNRVLLSTVAATSSGNTGSSALLGPGSTSSIRPYKTPICISRTETTTY